MTLLFTYVALALSVSFLCSLLEASLLTLTPSAVQTGKTKGLAWAPRLENLKADIDRPLAAILTLNTVAHTMGAAGAGAEYARVFGNGTEALFAAALTVAVLILTEIIPKTIGARFAVPLAPFTAAVLPLLITGLAPLVWFSRQVTRLITFGRAQELPRHREELMAVAHLGRESGELHARETQFLQNMLQLDKVNAYDIMTPRPVVFSLPAAMTSDEFIQRIDGKPFTRIPVYDRQMDDVRGFVIKGEVLMEHVKRGAEGLRIGEVMRPLESTHGAVHVDKLFQRFINERRQVMLVVDDYGTIAGIVTLEDVLETIFGFEIVDELDKVSDLQAYARDLWKQRASRLGIAPNGEGGQNPA
jgi:CBS domain containing-hemolysin-like protein